MTNRERGGRAAVRTKAITEDSLNAILRCLTPTNRLVCLVALASGLRITDVLNIRTEQLTKDRFTVFESKTGKKKVVRLPRDLRRRVAAQAGKVFAFENRLNGLKHRSRTTVWKDLNRVGKIFKLKGLAPHSMRKTYAKTLRAHGLTEAEVQQAMNHSSPAITRLYTMADELALR